MDHFGGAQVDVLWIFLVLFTHKLFCFMWSMHLCTRFGDKELGGTSLPLPPPHPLYASVLVACRRKILCDSNLCKSHVSFADSGNGWEWLWYLYLHSGEWYWIGSSCANRRYANLWVLYMRYFGQKAACVIFLIYWAWSFLNKITDIWLETKRMPRCIMLFWLKLLIIEAVESKWVANAELLLVFCLF